jgi:hypothetical protein
MSSSSSSSDEHECSSDDSNSRELNEAARRSGMTRQELEDAFWKDEMEARKNVNARLIANGATPIDFEGTGAMAFAMDASMKLKHC